MVDLSEISREISNIKRVSAKNKQNAGLAKSSNTAADAAEPRPRRTAKGVSKRTGGPLTKPLSKIVPSPTGGAQEGAGRPPFQFTEKDRILVAKLAGWGVPQVQIGALIGEGICQDTLMKYFEKELILGKARANSKVGQILLKRAVDGDTSAAIWWSKTQMGWKEPPKGIELESPNGTMSPKGTKLDPSKMSTEALRELMLALEQAQDDSATAE